MRNSLIDKILILGLSLSTLTSAIAMPSTAAPESKSKSVKKASKKTWSRTNHLFYLDTTGKAYPLVTVRGKTIKPLTMDREKTSIFSEKASLRGTVTKPSRNSIIPQNRKVFFTQPGRLENSDFFVAAIQKAQEIGCSEESHLIIGIPSNASFPYIGIISTKPLRKHTKANKKPTSSMIREARALLRTELRNLRTNAIETGSMLNGMKVSVLPTAKGHRPRISIKSDRVSEIRQIVVFLIAEQDKNGRWRVTYNYSGTGTSDRPFEGMSMLFNIDLNGDGRYEIVTALYGVHKNTFRILQRASANKWREINTFRGNQCPTTTMLQKNHSVRLRY